MHTPSGYCQSISGVSSSLREVSVCLKALAAAGYRPANTVALAIKDGWDTPGAAPYILEVTVQWSPRKGVRVIFSDLTVPGTAVTVETVMRTLLPNSWG